MTRTVVTATTILLLAVLVGCQDANQGRSAMLPRRDAPYAEASNPVPIEMAASADEIDLVEQMATHRQAYRRSLELLIQHYDVVGNHSKLTWAQTELQALDRIPQYRYIVEMPTTLTATERIQAADDLYAEAMEMERKAGVLPVLKDEEVLRAALGKYADVISRYPASDKIDDAAFKMGGIHEYFNDFMLALSYYQRAYQWDASTPYPARFKAAWILDTKLRRRAEALQLYQESLIKDSLSGEQRAYGERRIRELSTSDNTTAQ